MISCKPVPIKTLFRNVKIYQKASAFSCLNIISYSFEIASIGLLFPLIALATNDSYEPTKTVQYLVNLLNLNQSNLVFSLGLLFATLSIVSGALKIFNESYSRLTVANIGSQISSKLFTTIIWRTYSDYTKSNSSSVISLLTAKISHTLSALNAFSNLFSAAISIVIITIGLFVITLISFAV